MKAYKLIAMILAIIMIFSLFNSCTDYEKSDFEDFTETTKVTVTVEEGDMVWIPTRGGIKYHKTPTCSGMIKPKQTTKRDAIIKGFDPCKKCYRN